MSGWQGPPVLVGERALWLGSGSGLPKPGIVKWIGRLQEIGPDWSVGLELDEALPVGGIDGTWGGRVLFVCKEKHGLLVPISSIIPGSQLRHKDGSNFEKKKNAADHSSGGTLPSLSKQALTDNQSVVTEDTKGEPKPALRQKRRIPTPPSDSDEPPVVPVGTDQATLRVEEKDQEDSLKKRLRLFTNNGQRSMNGLYNDCSMQDVVDSLYAQRRQQFAKHGRSQSDSAHGFISSSSQSRRDRSSAIFSIFRWFRKENRSSFDAEFAPSAPPSPQLIRSYGSRCGSVDTLFSTATASSFAFVHPASYRPFGAANAPELRILPGPETETYRNRLRQRDRIRELDKNLTLRKKYHLFGSGTLHRSADDVNNRNIFLHSSLDSLKAKESSSSRNSTLGRKKRKAPPPPVIEEKSQERSLPTTLESNKENTDINASSEITVNRPRHRRTVSDSAKDRKSGAFVHVRGKRKAPPPPIVSNNNDNKDQKTSIHEGTQSLGRKKRIAPPPPLEITEDDSSGNNSGSPGYLNPGEKQRLIENIAKLQAHANRNSLILSTPPESPSLGNKMAHTVCNDTLKLERGVLKANKVEVQSSEPKPLTPTPVSPRPWYKRNSANKEKSLEKKRDKNKIDDWMPEVAIARGNVVSQDTNSHTTNVCSNSTGYRLSSIFSRFEKTEEKRKSQISMLANISELDREAAEIVQREHEKEKALLAAEDAKYYPSLQLSEVIVNKPIEEEITAMENGSENGDLPKRSGARELISLFNAIGNVTKVTVNSAFFSKEGPSIFTKEGIEKRFSMSGDSATSAEKHVKESVSNSGLYARQTVIVETNETYMESPGVKRRRNFNYQDTKEDSPEATSSKVTIEEVDDDKSKIQALFEANKIRKHQSPSPSIPTIAEMSESISSVASSVKPDPIERSTSSTPTPVSSAIVADTPVKTPPTSNYSIWSCPRCTLENPRWRVTCEACDMWRPAVRRDVIDKLTNANMGTTIAVNIVKKASGSKSINETKHVTAQETAASGIFRESKLESKPNAPKLENKIPSASSAIVTSGLSKPVNSKPITVSSLLSCDSYRVKESDTAVIKEGIDNKQNVATVAGTSSTIVNSLPSALPSVSSPNITQKQPKIPEITPKKFEDTARTEETSSKVDNGSDLEEVRKARLAFFKRSQLDSNSVSNESSSKEIPKSKTTVDPAKIDMLFSIASKGSLATNEEERLKVKELLKEMKNSLPKRSKDSKAEVSTSNGNTRTDPNLSDNIKNSNSPSSSTNNAARLGAIKKSKAPNAPAQTKKVDVGKQRDEKRAEVYLVKSETVIEEIKVKAKEDIKSKVSTSAQTNGVIRIVEPSSAVKNNEVKPVTGKPPTPKSTRKDIIVPVTVEEHQTENGVVHLTSTKEPRKMGIGAFQLIRPRDFANIEATKAGVEGKVHVYANIPSTHHEDSSSSSSSDSPEISQLTAQLSKPKGLANFKAAMLEGAAGNKMNTLAVNRLLRQLETAIAGGEHQRAATLAKELAKHKVNCCVTRQKHSETIPVDIYVEDKLSHQGPFPLQVAPSMTVAQLKLEVQKQFEMPTTVQRWILGKALATDDSATLQQLGVNKPHCPLFLYLVAPDGGQDKAETPEQANEAVKVTPPPVLQPEPVEVRAEATAAPPTGRGWYFNEQHDRYSYCESEVTDQSSKDPSPEPRPEVAGGASTNTVTIVEDIETSEEEVEVQEESAMATAVGVAASGNETSLNNHAETATEGWKCDVCTLVNESTRPGCLACAADRPANYRVGSVEREEQRNQQAEADEEKKKNYEQLMAMENADLIISTEPFECSICLVACEANDGVTLRDCLHTFCRACLAHTVQFTEDAEVKCPFRDHSYACDSTLQEREIKALVTPEIYEQHLAKSVTQAENKIGNAFHCKTPDCPGWCIFEDNVNTFQCPVCNQANCLTCQAIHTGVDCKEYQEKAQQEAETNADARRTREMLEDMVRRGEALACPTCQVLLLKKWGCDWLRCSMCKTEICWVTKGPRWGPNGKGDTSGGCQCGVNGVKCHPKCNYCH